MFHNYHLKRMVRYEDERTNERWLIRYRCNDQCCTNNSSTNESDYGYRRTFRKQSEIWRCTLCCRSDSTVCLFLFTILVVSWTTEKQTIDWVCFSLPDKFSSIIERLSRPKVTNVTADHMNSVLGSVLKLINNNIDATEAPWMKRIAGRKYGSVFGECFFVFVFVKSIHKRSYRIHRRVYLNHIFSRFHNVWKRNAKSYIIKNNHWNMRHVWNHPNVKISNQISWK